MAADGVDIGALAGRVEFEDHVSKSLLDIANNVDKLNERFNGLNHGVKDAAGGFLLAEVSLGALKKAGELAVDVIGDLTVGGAQLSDITENFQNLAMGAGRLSTTMLGALRDGIHGTVSDIDLMTRVNQNMAAGMKLTDEQLRLTAQGAFALAQATGGDVKNALDTVNDALLTGRVRSLQALTSKIDLSKVEEEYAARLGVTADRLTAEAKLEATREAIFKSVGAAVQRLGEQTDGVDDMWEQAQVASTNFWNELSVKVGTSGEVVTAFVDIRNAVFGAFGGDSQKAMDSAVSSFKTFAEFVSTVGPPIIATLGKIGEGFKFYISGLTADIQAGQDVVQKYALMLQGFSAAEADAAVKTYHLTQEQLVQSRAMADASKETEQAAKIRQIATTEAERAASVEEKNRLIISQTTEEIRKRKEAMAEIASATGTYKEIVAGLDADMVKSVKAYMEAGVAQEKLAIAYKLTNTELTAITKVLKDETEAQKLSAKQATDSAERWADLAQLKRSMSGTMTDQLIADIDRWRAAEISSHKSAKTDTADFYAWLRQMEQAQVEAADQNRLLQDTQSKAYWEQQKRDAEDAYNFALTHADQFTQGYINDLERTKVAAASAAENWQRSASQSLDTIAGKVRTLAGEWITLEEQMKRRAQGSDRNVTKDNFQDMLKQMGLEGFGGEAERMAAQGYSFQEIVETLRGSRRPNGKPSGNPIPGFGVEERSAAPEQTATFQGGRNVSQIAPRGSATSDMLGGSGMVNNFFTNGADEKSADVFAKIIMAKLKLGRKLGTA